MRGLWLEQGRFSYREDLPAPVPRAGEALIRVLLAGLCSTDLELGRGYLPFQGIPGHEFVGEVLAAEEAPALVGQRVVGEINLPCAACPTCRAGRPRHCPTRTVLGIAGRDGVFAELTTLPLANLHPVPAVIADEAAVFVEPLAAALEIEEQLPLGPGERVLLLGAGRLGQLIAQTLALTGCELRVVARHPRARALIEARGLAVLEPSQIAAAEMDVVVEATGDPAAFALARRAVRPRGTLVLKSTYAGEQRVNLSSIVVDELTLLGSRCGPFPRALELLGRGAVDVAPLVDACYPLAAAAQALAEAERPGALKILLRP